MQESFKTNTLLLEEKLKNHKWVYTLAFLVDLTESLYNLNLKHQGKNQNNDQLMCQIDSFRRKRYIFKDNMEKNDPTHFADYIGEVDIPSLAKEHSAQYSLLSH